MLNSLRIPLILVGIHLLLSVYSVNCSSQFISLLSHSQITLNPSSILENQWLLVLSLTFQINDDQWLSPDPDSTSCPPSVYQLLFDARLHDLQCVAMYCRHSRGGSGLFLFRLEARCRGGCQWTLPLVNNKWQTQFQFCDIFFCFKSFEKIILQGHGPVYFI